MTKLLSIMLLISSVCVAQIHPYQDLSHDSKVFGQPRTFRIYMPEGYNQSAKQYPVIYFFHGNGGRYYKDNGAKLEYDLLGRLVDKYQVIMVMWDGNMEESEPRPYNTGDREHVKYPVQMKDYFLELVNHIDTNYRTLTDRDHRGIIGYSMGGFMSMFIAGKYPDKVSAITDLVGSPEFFIGYPETPVLYPLRYTFENLRDVSVRIQSMHDCPLALLNKEVKNGAEWEGMPVFEFWEGIGGHKVDDPGETEVFEMAMNFIVNRFNHPVPPEKKWSHYDIYPEFDVWGYSITSDKKDAGYLYLRNVSPTGFGLYSRKWLPDGPPIKTGTTTITTPPIYKEGDYYDILLYQRGITDPIITRKKADPEGRLQFQLSSQGSEVSISHKSQPADFIVLNHRMDKGKQFLRVNEPNELGLTLLNRGGNAYTGKKVQLKVNCADPSVSFSNAVQEIVFDKNGRVTQSQPIGISCTKTPPDDGSPAWIKLNIRFSCDNDVFMDALTLPVYYEVPYFSDVQVDDGRILNEKDGLALGTGNGNGQGEASESLMIYANGHRLRLYTDDPYVETALESEYIEIVPGGIWERDGFTLCSIVKIADNCPPGHTIEFLSNYETKTRQPIGRVMHWGKVKITVI